MKKFRYRLEALLRAKEYLEKERQKQHAASLKQVHNQHLHLKQVNQEKGAILLRQSRGLTGSVSMAEMLIYSRYIRKLKRDMLAGDELLKALHKAEEEKRKSLVEASKERKVYEKLKERRQEHFNEEVRLQTTKENDEIALSNFRFHRSNGIEQT